MTAHDDLLRILEHTDEAVLERMYDEGWSLDECASALLWEHRKELSDELRSIPAHAPRNENPEHLHHVRFGVNQAANRLYPEERR